MQRPTEIHSRSSGIGAYSLCRSGRYWQDGINACWPSDRVGDRGGAMANRAITRALMLAGTSLGAIALGTAAQAGGFFIHEQSTYFQGTSFAGAAAGGPALSSMFWNPATITQQNR